MESKTISHLSPVRHLILCAAMLGALLNQSCSGGNGQQTGTPKAVNTAVCRDANELPPTSFAGLTRPVDVVNAAFRVSGTISRVLVDEGQRVNKGQVIAIMDDRDYQVQLNATKAEYEQVKADAERVMAMYADSSTTAQNYDKARYGLEQMSQKLAHHSNQYNDTRLLAPMSGYVKRKLRESGESVVAGMPVVEISTSDRIEVEIELPAKEYMHLDEYTDFYCTFNVTGTQRFPLKVVRSGKEANANQLYTVYLQFSESTLQKGVTPGMSTMVYGRRVTKGTETFSEIVIPATSLVSDGNATYVFVYDPKAGVVHRRDVKLDLINPDGTVTISKGLEVGEKVVRTGARSLSDGQSVSELQPASKTNVGGMI